MKYVTYMGALTEVNALRVVLGKPALERLPAATPRGLRVSSWCCNCPIALAIGGAVTSVGYTVNNLHWTSWPKGTLVPEFVHTFDNEYLSSPIDKLDPWDLIEDFPCPAV